MIENTDGGGKASLGKTSHQLIGDGAHALTSQDELPFSFGGRMGIVIEQPMRDQSIDGGCGLFGLALGLLLKLSFEGRTRRFASLVSTIVGQTNETMVVGATNDQPPPMPNPTFRELPTWLHSQAAKRSHQVLHDRLSCWSDRI